MNVPEIAIAPDARLVGSKAANELLRAARETPSRGDRLHVAFSGGSTARYLLAALEDKSNAGNVPWERLDIYWSDERCVPVESADSNHGAALRQLLDRLPLAPEHLHKPPVEAGAPKTIAASYEATLRLVTGTSAPAIPRFDIVYLGLGLDAHIASLFPGSKALENKDRLVLHTRAPVQPIERISFSPAVLLAANRVVLLACGQEKAAVVKEVLESPPDPSRLPAQLLLSARGRVLWFLDTAAASLLSPRSAPLSTW
ncbi:MAG: 6-phosphogluconolactonase [Candidatus Wallbacteria bacterium]|nr:6-phosphogluconolactonase [Candidatus Wallbacteria bacterium]MBI4869729.1 6-phosphogluconolactonase [Candidatus Wallbacteria bacterium]